MAHNNVHVEKASNASNNVPVQVKEKIPAERTPTMRQFLLPAITFLYFFVYYMNTALAEHFLEYRVTKMILDHRKINQYIDLAGLSFCTLNYTDPRFFLYVELQIEMAPWRKNLYISSAIPGMISAFLLGPLSERFGRKLILLMPIAGVFVRAVGYMIVSQTQASLSMLYIPHALEGLFGFFPTFLMGAVTYICDITGKSKIRTILITMICALSPVAQIAYVYQVFAMKQWGYVYPNVLTMTFALATFLVTCFLLPKSRPEPPPHQSVWLNFKNIGKIYFTRVSDTPIAYFSLGYFIFGVVSLVFYGQTIMEPIYASIQPLCWNLEFSGNYEVFRGILQSVASVLIVVGAVPFFSDALIAVAAGILQTVGFIIQGYSTTTAMVAVSCFFGLGSTVTMAMVKVMMSKFIADEAFGALFSAIASLEVLTTSVSPITFIVIYNHFADKTTGASFFFMAGLMVLASLLYLAIYLHNKYRNRNANTYSAIQ